MGAAWEMRADIKQNLVVPAHIVSTRLRPDEVLWSSLEKVLYFIELMVPWEDRIQKAYELKSKAKYSELLRKATQQGWSFDWGLWR